jgi:hypothetical protein
MESGQPSLQFMCSGCGATVREIIEEIPSYDLMADRGSDAQGYAEQTVACPGCDQQFDVGMRLHQPTIHPPHVALPNNRLHAAPAPGAFLRRA